MKKLMVMLSAAAMAFGAFAAGFSASEAFEAATPDLSRWSNAAAADVGDGIHTLGESRPNAFIPEEGEAVANLKALNVKTTLGSNAAVAYNFNDSQTKAIGTGLYFDGIVKFTVFDMDDTPAADNTAKLAVYMQAADADATTAALIVRAADATGAAKDYVCTVTGATIGEGWHRLTIKAIDAAIAGKAGFVVYVDETMVTCADTKGAVAAADVALNAYSFYDKEALFISPVAGDSLSAVAFDGQGAIAEIEVSDANPIHVTPFAQDEGAFKVSVSMTNIEQFTINGTDYTASPAYIIYGTAEKPTKVTVAWTAKNGYVSDSKEFDIVNGTATITDSDIKPAAASFGGVNYETIAAAVTEANKDSASGMLTIIRATATDNVALNNANVTLDLNGQTVGDIGAKKGGKFLLTNTADTDATVEGAVLQDAIAINVKTINFNYEWNWDEESGKPYFDADFGENKWMFKPDSQNAYVEIIDKPADIDLANAEIELTAGSIVYGADAPTISSIKVNDVDVPSDAYTASHNYTKGTSGIGTYAWTVTAVEGKGYTGSKTADFTVTAAAATVTVDAGQTKVFGAVDPTLTATVTGLVGADTLAYTVTRAEGENVGTYAITAAGEATQGNYTVTYVGGEFTITAKALADVAVTLTPETATFDSAKTAPADYTAVAVSSAEAGFTLADCSVTWNPAEVTAAGEYKVTVAPKANCNYSFTAVEKTLTITAAAPDRPSDVEGGSPEQKEAYDQWAKDNDITGTAANNAVAFALGVTKKDIGEGTIEQAIEKKLDAAVALTADEVAALTTGETPAVFTLAGYPNAQFQFVETKDIQSATGKFFRLTAVFLPEN